MTLLFLSGCTLFFSGEDEPKSAKDSRYHVTFRHPDWKIKNDKRSDYIFENKSDGRILLSNSFCDEFQEQPLDRLALKTFSTIKDFKAQEHRYTTFHDREAHRLTGTGLVDGVRVSLELLNIRRDNCYFDFLAISPDILQKPDAAFEDFLKSVVFR